MQTTPRVSAAVAALDAIDAEDPTPAGPGESVTAAQLYGRRMLEALAELHPDASELLVVAVRAQHVGRFRIPRSSEPEGRVPYLRWRKRLAELHGELASRAARDAGFEDAEAERISFIVQKRALRSDPDSQALEDCACLVFLRHEFAAFADRTDDDKMIEILRKTWGKMSERAHERALQLPLAPRESALVARALAG